MLSWQFLQIVGSFCHLATMMALPEWQDGRIRDGQDGRQWTSCASLFLFFSVLFPLPLPIACVTLSLFSERRLATVRTWNLRRAARVTAFGRSKIGDRQPTGRAMWLAGWLYMGPGSGVEDGGRVTDLPCMPRCDVRTKGSVGSPSNGVRGIGGG